MPIRPIEITSYEQESSDKFIEQYKESNLQELVKSGSIEAQTLEDGLQEFYAKLPLQTATGQTLDEWGEHFDVERGGLSDTVYLDKILAQILSYTSSGLPEQIIQIIVLLTQATSVRIIESTTESRTISFDINTDLATISPDELKTAITRALESTVKLDDIIIISPVEYFGFDSDPDALGFVTLAEPSSGGYYSILI